MVACDSCKKWYHAECESSCLKEFNFKKWFFSSCIHIDSSWNLKSMIDQKLISDLHYASVIVAISINKLEV